MLFLFVFTSDNYLSSCVNSCTKLRSLDDELRLGTNDTREEATYACAVLRLSREFTRRWCLISTTAVLVFLSSQSQRGTPCGFNRSDIDKPPYRNPPPPGFHT